MTARSGCGASLNSEDLQRPGLSMLTMTAFFPDNFIRSTSSRTKRTPPAVWTCCSDLVMLAFHHPVDILQKYPGEIVL